MSRPLSWEDYFIPGTQVLRNLLVSPGKPYGETDPAILRDFEEKVTEVRMTELASSPVDGAFDYEHMKAIHRRIFQDVYEWEGQERTAPVGRFMVKDGHAYYPAGPALTAAAETEYRRLAGKNLLRGLETGDFVRELAESWGEINVIHSFREGNTRSQFIFFSQLCEHAGYVLEADRFAPGQALRDEFVAARFRSQGTGSNADLAQVLAKAVRPAPLTHQQVLDDLVTRTARARRQPQGARRSGRPRRRPRA
ncbi:Fic family protein [Actinomyces timonensis]|uniref:protein adenylyltransferase n=1 Tax=Actinomyces timonensis TaxID=1288391 RepID=A0AAU8N384_9ACTO